MLPLPCSAEPLDRDGFVLLRRVFSIEECTQIAESLEHALASDTASGGLRTERRALYGGRNLVQTCAVVRSCWRRGPLVSLLREVLGPEVGLVRALFFDKPPGASWSLAWHRDRTIAVAEHRPDLGPFRCPTVKAGVPHLEAPRALLAAMLTLRIHLDPMTEQNGPLLVAAGSHRGDEDDPINPAGDGTTVLADAGDVLAMRPLLLHASRASQADCDLHRRILHLEFAPTQELPCAYAWHDFEKCS